MFMKPDYKLIHQVIRAAIEAEVINDTQISYHTMTAGTVTLHSTKGILGKLTIRHTRDGRKLFWVTEKEVPFDFSLDDARLLEE